MLSFYIKIYNLTNIMKKSLFFLSSFLIFLVACAAQQNQEELVQEAYNNYKSAILNDKGEEAVNYVDSRTIKYYGDILETVKSADKARINSLSLLDKLMVLIIRHKVPKEDILSFDGKQLLIFAIKNGMVGKSSVSNNSIGEVIIDKEFAKGQYISNGKTTNVSLHFYKEEGQWKIDLTSIFGIANLAFKQMIDKSGEDEDVVIFSVLESMTGKKPTEEIWQPIN
jgi:hypothetical protein